MSDGDVCWFRWLADEIRAPGPCQCQRWAGHDGPHRCCCGEEDTR